MLRERYMSLVTRIKSSSRYVAAMQLPVWTLFKRLGEVDIFLIASAIAFSVLLTIIPMLIIFASVVGIVLSSSEAGVQQVTTMLDAMFPPQPFVSSIRESILQVVMDIIKYRTSLGIAGSVILLFTASFVFDIVRSALHSVYRIKRQRNLIVSFLHDLWFVLLAFALLIGTNIAIWALSFTHYVAEIFPPLQLLLGPESLKTVPTTIVVTMTAFMFYIVYGHITDSRPPTVAAIASTVTMTVIWLISGRIFSVYLGSFSLIGTIYGPYAFLIVLVVWIYYSSLIFVFGGVVGEVYWETLKKKSA